MPRAPHPGPGSMGDSQNPSASTGLPGATRGAKPEGQPKRGQCGSPDLPRTPVSFFPGPLGQGGRVKASPLTRCPGNTVGSNALTPRANQATGCELTSCMEKPTEQRQSRLARLA